MKDGFIIGILVMFAGIVGIAATSHTTLDWLRIASCAVGFIGAIILLITLTKREGNPK